MNGFAVSVVTSPAERPIHLASAASNTFVYVVAFFAGVAAAAFFAGSPLSVRPMAVNWAMKSWSGRDASPPS
jgi:hypothetical protein